MAKSKLLFQPGEDWNPDMLDKIWHEIEIIAKELEISYYEPQFEIISSDQMLEAYVTTGMPMMYKHWSFGQSAIVQKQDYENGKMGLAYEMVINSDPCIAYLMESNNALMQTLVMAHASVGHSAVYKNNVYFRENTDATSIIPYIDFAKKFITKCEAEHGIDTVERVLDACHAIQIYGVDKYRRRGKRSPKKLTDKVAEFDLMHHTLMDHSKANDGVVGGRDPGYMEPEENILYFIEKRAPNLEPWQREIIRIVRKISQYFLPQRQMQIVHEGYASFTHYYIMHRLYDKGLISDGSMLEFYASHSGVLTQHSYKHTSQLNPYRFGFKMFMDIKKKAEEAGKHWQTEVNYAMQNFNDESFIAQYLSLEVAQDFGLFGTSMNNDESLIEVREIPRNGRMLDELKIRLSRQHSLSYRVPDIQVVGVDVEGDRTLFLEHFTNKEETRKLDSLDALYTLEAIKSLWGHRVRLISPDLRKKDTEYEKIDDTTVVEKGTKTLSGHIGELRGRPFLEA